MNALTVSSDLKEFMDKNSHMIGQVHSVFNSAVNLITESDNLITLLVENKSITPMSLTVKCDDFQDSFIKKGSPVILTGSKISFPDDNEQISLKNVNEWCADANLKFKPANPNVFKKHITMLENVISREGNMDGIATVVYHLEYPGSSRGFDSKKSQKMNQYASFIHDRIQQFMYDFQADEKTRWQEDLRRIIGFGPGLTPSTDDFFVGFSASLLYMTRLFGIKKRFVNHVNKSIYECSQGRTTRISEELIKHATEGKMSKLLQEVFESLFSNNDGELHCKLSELIAYGDTSGTDLLSGVYVAVRMFDSEEVRRIYS